MPFCYNKQLKIFKLDFVRSDWLNKIIKPPRPRFCAEEPVCKLNPRVRSHTRTHQHSQTNIPPSPSNLQVFFTNKNVSEIKRIIEWNICYTYFKFPFTSNRLNWLRPKNQILAYEVSFQNGFLWLKMGFSPNIIFFQ